MCTASVSHHPTRGISLQWDTAGCLTSCVWSGFTIEDMIWDGMGLGGLFLTLSLGGIKGMGVGNTGRTGRIWLFSREGGTGLEGQHPALCSMTYLSVVHFISEYGPSHVDITATNFHRRCAICVAHCLLSELCRPSSNPTLQSWRFQLLCPCCQVTAVQSISYNPSSNSQDSRTLCV